MTAHQFAPALALLFGLSLAAARAQDGPREKLDAAKKDWDAEVEKYKKAVGDYFDKREEAARAKGDKKAVDQIKKDRAAFDATSKLPALAKQQSFMQPISAARTKYNTAFLNAVEDFTKGKLDEAADSAEKERQEFLLEPAILIDKMIYLASLKHLNLKAAGPANNPWFTNDGTQHGSKVALKVNGEPIPNSIFIHGADKGVVEVSYPIGGRTYSFRGSVGVPSIEDGSMPPASPLQFEILGDGKSLWKSEPGTKIDAYQAFAIKLEKVKPLTLRVHCPGSSSWARATWVEPVLIEP